MEGFFVKFSVIITWQEILLAPSCCPPPHAVARQPPGPTPTALERPFPRHATPVVLRGRHLAATMASSWKSPGFPFSCTLQHQGNFRIPIPSLSRHFPAPNLQNAATARPNADELELTVAPLLHGRSARADPTPSSTSFSCSSCGFWLECVLQCY